MAHHMHHHMDTTTMMNHHNHHNMSGMGPTNMSHTGNMTGHGDMHGGMHGDMHGDMHGGMHGDMHGGMHGDMHGGMHGMNMYFHTGVTEWILFEPCHTRNDKEMIAACVAIFFLAILYEGLKFLRESLLHCTLQDRSRVYSPDKKLSPSPSVSQETMIQRGSDISVSKQMLSCDHVIQTFLHVLQIFISYCLMLVFMTYNVWLCLAVVLGAGAGYFAFGWKRAVVVDANEHCH